MKDLEKWCIKTLWCHKISLNIFNGGIHALSRSLILDPFLNKIALSLWDFLPSHSSVPAAEPNGKQCRSWWDGYVCADPSVSTQFAKEYILFAGLNLNEVFIKFKMFTKEKKLENNKKINRRKKEILDKKKRKKVKRDEKNEIKKKVKNKIIIINKIKKKEKNIAGKWLH